MANRDDSTELKADAPKAPRIFPTSHQIMRARRASGKIRPNQPDSIHELLGVAQELFEGREEVKGD